MKKRIMCVMSSAMLVVSGFSQSNNPFNADGISAVKNALYMRQQVRDGNVVTTDQKIIQKYNDELKIGPLNAVTDITTKTYQTVTAPGFESISYIQKSGLPASVKKEVLDMNAAATANSSNQYKEFLVKKADFLKTTSDLNQSEKNSLLKLCAIYYQATEAGLLNSNAGNSQKSRGPNDTVLGFMAAGFAIGSVAGGIFGSPELGAAIGAGVGFIVGLCITVS